MGLQFNPPEWLLQEYMNRKRPIDELGDQVKAIGDQNLQRQQQAQALKVAQDTKRAEQFKAIADYLPEQQIPGVARQYGINIPQDNFTPPTQSTGTIDDNMNPIAQPQSPIIQHFQSLNQTAPGGLPPRPTSKHGLDKYKENLGLTKTESDLSPKTPITKEALMASGKPFDPMTQMIVEPAAPKDAGGEKLSDKQLADAQKAYNSDKNREKAEAVVEKVSQAVPLLQAGQVDNATAKQALQTAMTYMATGGMRVNEVELKQFGGANALTNKMAQWYQGLDKGTLTARDAKDMASVLDIFQKSAHKNLQESGLRHTRQYLQRSRSGEKESDAYKRVSGMDFIPDESGSATGPHGASVTQGGHTYNWNAQKKQYE